MPIPRRVTIPGTVTKASDVYKFIDLCFDIPTLRAINHAAFEKLRAVQNGMAKAKIRQFEVNDRVRFTSKDEGVLHGFVTGVARTRVRVTAWSDLRQQHVKWRVHVSHLEHDDPPVDHAAIKREVLAGWER